ncbi:MAG TPA: 2-oxoacid:ferredoxin oxidoreductase subunit beta, partial [Actinophytocola sp.]|nr:2-oxoacid:ferredoxin oxidoreductase subunit beta [Actinophytocola sp.]
FDVLKEPGQREQRLIPVEHGKPIVFGTDGDHAVVRTDYGFDIARTADVDPGRIVVHDATIDDPAYAFALSRLSTQDLAHTVTGIYRDIERPAYDDLVRRQTEVAAETTEPNLAAMLAGNDTWQVS